MGRLAGSIRKGFIGLVREQRGDWFEKDGGVEYEGRMNKDGTVVMTAWAKNGRGDWVWDGVRKFKITVEEVVK